MSRPEHIGPPEIFYNEDESRKYTSNSRMIEIQSQMSERAYELLAIDPNEGPKVLLDIGCGSGLSGKIIEQYGHICVGIDISPHMLNVYRERDECEGDVFLGDMGNGLFFRPGVFDGAISISALQWLCNADKSWHNPKKRLTKFFTSLYGCLARGSRCVFQFYPENPSQMELVTTVATKCGFTGGLLVDYPNSTKAKKYFLCLFAGTPVGGYKLPKALGEEDQKSETVNYSTERVNHQKPKRKQREPVKSRNWVLKKKESQRRKGKEVRPDSKFTGRKRSTPF